MRPQTATPVVIVGTTLFFLGLCLTVGSSPRKFLANPNHYRALDVNAEIFRRDQLLEDLQIVRQALEEGHIGIYRYVPETEVDRHFDKATQSINQSMDTYEFYRILAPAIAAIKCGHTRLALPDRLRQELETKLPLLPMTVRVLDKKAYVFREFSSSKGELAGKEIISVNGVPASKLVETMIAATPRGR